MPETEDLQSICDTIRREYSACDISDALLKLKIPSAGCINPDISSVSDNAREKYRLVAPLSTVRYVRKSEIRGLSVKSNIPKGQNWTDHPAPGTVVLVQQPEGQSNVALLGDIMVTRMVTRGMLGAVVDGRIRDVDSCIARCHDGEFQLWSRGFSPMSPTLEIVPWEVDVPLHFGDLTVSPGDILCADEGDRAVVVIPRSALDSILEILPVLKKASDGVMEDVVSGMSLPEAVKRHPKFYSNYS